MVYSLRVPWVPLVRFPSPRPRGFATHAAFPHSDYYAPSDCLRPRSFVGVSPSYFPPSFASLAGSPVFTMEDSNKTM